MKSLAAVLAILVLVPAAIFACHCCPPAAQNPAPVIEKEPCHSCCPDMAELRACDSAAEKPAILTIQTGPGVPANQALTLLKLIDLSGETRFPVSEASPPLAPLALTSILRI